MSGNPENGVRSQGPLMNAKRTAVLVALAAGLLGTLPALAGSLELAWTPSTDPALDSYRLHVGTAPGKYDRVVDTREPRALLTDLADGKTYYMRVEALTAKTKKHEPEALSISPEISSLPGPVVTWVGAPVPAGDGETFEVLVQGLNLSDQAVVHLATASLEVLSTDPVSEGTVRVVFRLGQTVGQFGLPAITPADVIVVNPGRKAPEFFERNALRADVDGDGVVGQSDLDLVAGLLGATESEGRFSRAADLNGDGLVDGDDLVILGSRFRGAGSL